MFMCQVGFKVLNIYEHFKENVCNRHEIVTSMSPLSHLMIMLLLQCNQLKLTCFTNMTSMNDFWLVKYIF